MAARHEGSAPVASGLVRTRLHLLAVVLVALVVPAAPAAAGVDTDTEVVGGDRLSDSGLVVDDDAPELPSLSASSWLVADLDSGEVLAAKDPHGRYAPASTLKALTALTLIPRFEATHKVVPTFDDINVEGSKVGLVERVGYPMSELFSALFLASGNDAANVLATAAGGQEATAALMNDTARSLHAYDTRAVNPHGLDAEGQVSSAYDLALIARAGMSDPDFASYASAVRGSVSAPGSARIEMYTKNKLLTSYEGGLGIKNGYTSRARASFIGAAQRGDTRLVVTLMKADPRVADEAMKLLDWGFAAAGEVRPVGELVDPQTPAEEIAGTETTAVQGRAATVPGGGAGGSLPITLGGIALAGAAVLSVRHKPEPVRRAPLPAQRLSPPPAQRVPVRR